MADSVARVPSWQRIAAVTLILAQATNIAWLMDVQSFGVFVALVALAGLAAPSQGLLKTFSQPIANVSILAFFGLRYAVASTELDPDREFINSPFALEVASACLVIQLSVLFQSAYARRLPVWFLTVSSIGYVFSGDIRLPTMLREEFLALNSLYFLCWGIYGASCRQRSSGSRPPDWRWYAIVGSIFVVATFTLVGLSRAFQRYEHAFERWLSEQFFEGPHIISGIGFAGTGGLSEITNFKLQRPEMRTLIIHSDQPPGYLRGKVFHLFDGQEWNELIERRPVRPLKEIPTAVRIPRRSDQLFQFDRTSLESNDGLDVWPQSDQLSWFVFAPLETVAVAANATSVMLSRDRIISWGSRDALTPYSLFIGETTTETLIDDGDYLALPQELDPRLESLAAALFRDADTFIEKQRALEEFFEGNFQYRLGGGRGPREENRLLNFLFNDRAGHCEYFATATALLLRLGGVPSRYVTGFVATEQNVFDGTWIARNKDAHAWVEAYDATAGRWVTIERTPSAGIPAPSTPSWQSQCQEAIAACWKRLVTYIRLGLFWELLTSIVRATLWPMLLGMTAWTIWRFVVRQVRSPDPTSERKLAADVLELSRERELVDRQLVKQGLVRAEGETILAFARRVQEQGPPECSARFADWYRRYALLRYGDRPVTSLELEAMRRERISIQVPQRSGVVDE